MRAGVPMKIHLILGMNVPDRLVFLPIIKAVALLIAGADVHLDEDVLSALLEKSVVDLARAIQGSLHIEGIVSIELESALRRQCLINLLFFSECRRTLGAE